MRMRFKRSSSRSSRSSSEAQLLLRALRRGFGRTSRSGKAIAKRAHPSDVPIIQEFASKKADLCKAMGGYLSVYGREDC
jgi:hypothetical protein